MAGLAAPRPSSRPNGNEGDGCIRQRLAECRLVDKGGADTRPPARRENPGRAAAVRRNLRDRRQRFALLSGFSERSSSPFCQRRSGIPRTAADGVSGSDEAVWPMPQWSRAAPAEVGMDEAKLAQARDYALTGGGSGYITRHGRLVLAWGDPRQRYDLKSTTKSFGSIALGSPSRTASCSWRTRRSDITRRWASRRRERADRLAGRDHHPAPGVADRRV